MARLLDVAAVHDQSPDDSAGRGSASLRQLEDSLHRLDGTGVGLVVTGEGMALARPVDSAESLDAPGELLTTYASFARRNACVVAGAVLLRETDCVYNAQAVFGPEGTCLGRYRKTFCTPAELKQGIAPGSGAEIVQTPIGRLGGAICFDLNFPELRRAYAAARPDLLIFSSLFHGGLLQALWAFECRAFFVAACRDISSDITDPFGRRLATTSFHARIARARINLDRFAFHLGGGHLEKCPSVQARYGRDIRLDLAPDLAWGLLYSETPERTAAEFAAEAGFIDGDEFLSSSRLAGTV